MAFKGFRFAGLEMKDIMSGKAMKLILAGIAIIPCLYGALYLAAFLDPYQELNKVPVAVVNLDEGAEIDGEERNVGEEVCDTIAARTDGLQWHFVSKDDAQEGLEAGTYYMTCTIPQDFSQMIASADTSTPEHAQMVVDYNQSSNMLASQIGATVWSKVQKAVNDTISEQYWQTALKKTDEAGDSLSQAATGAEQLATGLEAAQQGNAAITEGLGGMATGVSALQGGLDALASGGQQLGAGVTALSANSAALRSGASALAKGLSAFEGSADLTKDLGKLTEGLDALNEGLQSVAASVGNSSTPGASLAYGSQAVTSGLVQLGNSLDTINNSAVTPLKSGLGALSAGLTDMRNAVDAIQVPQSSDALAAGLTQASQAAQGVAGAVDGAQGAVQGASTDIEDAKSQVESLVESGVLTAEQAQAITGELDGAQAQLGTASQSLTGASNGAASLAASLGESANNVPDTAALAQAVNGLSAGLNASIQAIGTASDDAQAGSQTLYAAANATSAGLTAARAGIGNAETPNTLAFASNSVTTGLDALGQGLGAITQNFGQMAQGIEGLAGQLPSMFQGLNQAAQGAEGLAQGVDAYTNGVDMVAQNVPAFVQGASAAAEGTDALAAGATALQQGSAQLGAGLGTAAEGNQSLADNLAEGADEMKMSKTERDEKSAVMSNPVELDDEYFTTVKNYGSGFAPYFIALGLWVGCLVASFAIRPLNTRLISSGAHPVMVAFSGFLPLAAFAVLQAVLLMAVLQFGLKLQIDSVPQFYAFGMLAAVVFAAVIQLLMAAFGFSGRFIAIILLMLQLTSSAGTFPIETAPLFFQIVHPLMPMTYVVDGMRQLTTGIGFDIALQSAAVLVVFGLVALVLTAVVAWRKRMVRMETLYPMITLPSA